MIEMIDILDADGNQTGCVKEKNAVHHDGDWHREVRIWVVNKNLEVLLQRRALSKKIHPGHLSCSAGGHISAGETSLQAAKREVAEELGIDSAPQYLSTNKYSEHHGNENITNCFFDVYAIYPGPDISNFKIQKEELEEVFYVPISFVRDSVENGNNNADFGFGEYGSLMDFITQVKKGSII